MIKKIKNLDFSKLQKLAIFFGLFLLIIIFSISSPAFFSVSNAFTLALQVSIFVILGIGVSIVIITGGIDLSVGSVLALSGTVWGMLVYNGITNVPIGLLIGILAGGVCGFTNGLMVTKLKLPPFIATLGMMMLARGVVLQISGAKAISDLPESFGAVGNGSLFRKVELAANGMPKVIFPGIPFPVIIMTFVAIVLYIMLNKFRMGRYIYATGSNEEAARLSGIKVDKVKIFAYTLSGLLAGIAGVILMSRLVSAQPNSGVAYELDAIASAVLGGTSLTGGVGTVGGTVLGAFIIGVLKNGLNMNGISSFIQQIIIGLVIIATVAADQIKNKKIGGKK